MESATTESPDGGVGAETLDQRRVESRCGEAALGDG
jgi:hypothetical protein